MDFEINTAQSARVLGDKRRFPPLIAILIAAFLGLAAGIGSFTMYYADGFSYMSSKPEVCVNCHIMQPQYDAWQKSPHHAAAGCVDCHLPHDLVGKYIAKAENGYHHSKAFTLQNFHEPILIKEKNSRILQQNCLRCHGVMVHGIVTLSASGGPEPHCVHCHASVGHGETAGLGGPEHSASNAKETP